jgi:hypothetical protein
MAFGPSSNSMTGDHRMFFISPIIATPPAAHEIRVPQTIVGICTAALLACGYVAASCYF